MASSSSSLPPPSPRSPRRNPASTSASPFESLIPHLLASKRSLSSVSSVYRANELCSSTRLALENAATITARTSFLHSGINSQLEILRRVHDSAANNAKQGRAEFDAVVRDLDEADRRLKGTMEDLKETAIEAGLRPKAEEKRSLLSFVDERAKDSLIMGIKEAIDGASESIQDFEEANEGFMESLGSVERLLHGGRKGASEPMNETFPLSDILHEMEGFAKSMARELEGLVSHYDMCVMAIRHVEGGGDAVARITNDLPQGVDIGQDNARPPEPIDDEQRRELIGVIENDASHVEDIMIDIRDHLMEMESLHDRVTIHTGQLEKAHETTIAAFKSLEAMGQKLPGFITRSEVFLLRWDSERAKIDDQLQELEDLSQIYSGFLRAYDNLLIEVGRRKLMEEKMDKEVQAAKTRLEKLYIDDAQQREAFRREQGDCLPVDIWPDLAAAPMRFEIAPVNGEMNQVPDISKSVIHRAIRRVHGDKKPS